MKLGVTKFVKLLISISYILKLEIWSNLISGVKAGMINGQLIFRPRVFWQLQRACSPMPPRSIFALSDDFLLPLVHLAFKGNLLVVIYIGFMMLPGLANYSLILVNSTVRKNVAAKSIIERNSQIFPANDTSIAVVLKTRATVEVGVAEAPFVHHRLWT